MRSCGRPHILTPAVLSLIIAFHVVATAKETASATNLAGQIRAKINQDYAHLEHLYKHLHAHPELSFREEQTSLRMAKEMRAIGFDVTEKFGGHGVVAILKNGEGPTVLVRTDTDALPVVEETGLAYASKVRVRDDQGNEVGVMHACGHDMHMTCWVGAASVLNSLKDKWKGTLIFIAQPAEERGSGARMMIEAGLFTKFPKPDYALALHCDNVIPAGKIGHTEGMTLANVDSVDIIVRGRGGHGSAPHGAIDPIVIAARLILDLQTLVSREIDPTDSAVVTVGSIHGGSKHNIIPNDVKLQLTIRTFKDSTRAHVLDGIKRMAKAAAEAARAPEPIVKVDPGEFTPALYNDPSLTRRTVEALKEALGANNVIPKPPVMGGEDFSRYAKEGIPVCFFRLGTLPEEQIQAAARGGRPLPSLHSSTYAPVPEPSIKTGVLAMSAAVLNLVGTK